MNKRTLFSNRIGLAAAVGALVFVLGCTPSAQPAQPSGQPAEKPAAGQPGQPKLGGTLVLLMNQAGDPPSFDLHQESTSATTESAGPAYDNLVRFDPMKPNDDVIIPDLAEKWEVSKDGKTYTFTLRKGVKFHNGNPFTAADVKFTLDRVKDPPKGVRSPRQTAFDPITSIETPDDSTVVIKLERPYASLLVNLAQGWMPIYDKEWIEAKGNDAPTKEMMGTGPFKLDRYTRGTEVVHKKDPNYWNKGLPYLDGLKTLIVPDPNTRLAALRTGQVHLLSVNTGDFEKLKTELGDKAKYERLGSLGFGSLYMNTTRKPYDNPKVREALNLSVSRQDAVKVLAQGDALLGGYMRPGGPWSLSDEEILKLPGYGQDKTKDLERAKQLLAEAGYPNGFEAVVKTRQSQGYIDLSVFLIDQLKKIGVNATLKPFETAQIYDFANAGDYDLLAWTHGFALDDPDAVYNEFYLCNSPRNWSKLCSPQVDELYMKQSQELDPAKRKALMMELERKAVPTASKIISQWSVTRSVQWQFVQNYTRHASSYNNIRYDQVWLDK